MPEKKLKMSLSDSTQKFILENHNVRGVIVHLTHSFRAMLEKHDYPLAVQTQLGEILLAAAMLAETIKLSGRMTIQFQSDGALKMLVAQINDEGHLRGLARWDATATEAELAEGLGEGSLVLTIFQKHQEQPMQSIVPLQHRSIAEALAFYFLQSEQLPTVFSFAVKEDMASGFLLQMMPEQPNQERNNAWNALAERVKKIDARELFYDNNASFLQHHFADANIRIFDSHDLVFKCGCSIEKMEQAIRVMGQAEANVILQEASEIVVTCEYCNQQYAFDRAAVETLFRAH